MTQARALALYVHWPFCVSKCPYCDFNSRPLGSALEEEKWAAAYQDELAAIAPLLGAREIGSLYFGGGTPSLMKPQTVQVLIDAAQAIWSFAPDCEITLEANPSSSEQEKFKSFRLAGVNRLSLGVQALDDASLRFLGRAHDAASARQAIAAAAQSFERWSFDLIYARAGQTAASWRAELAEALSFAPRHLSLYQLTIEEGTPFYKRARREALQTDEETSAHLYELTQEVLSQAGLPAYEISNHAAAGQESRHNLTYWTYGDYLGLGPGAHSRYVTQNGTRVAAENTANPQKWLEGVSQKGLSRAQEETLSAQTAMQEALMMGLRLACGVEKARWQLLFGAPLEAFLTEKRIEKMVEEKLLETTKETLRATPAGRERLNAVLGYLLA